MQQSYEMAGEAAGPEESVQLIHQVPADGTVTLRGVLLCEGFEVATIYLGKHKFSLEEAIGKVVPPGSYLIVLAKNTTVETMSVKGACVLEGDRLPPPNVLPGLGEMQPARQAPALAAPSPQPVTATVEQVTHLTNVVLQPAPLPIAGPQPPNKPGPNEVWVLLSVGHAEELSRCLKTQMFPHGATVADVTRRIDAALKARK